MSDVRLPLLSVLSPAATADSPPSGSFGLVVPGYDEWPGGDVVSVGGVLYAGGVYGPGDAPAGVFAGADESWLAMSPGVQAQVGYLTTTPHPVRGTWGPLARFRTPTWPDITTRRVFHLRVQWVEGYLSTYDAGGGRQGLSLPWWVTLRTDDDSLSVAFDDQTYGVPVSENVWDVTMSAVPPVTSATCLTVDASEISASQASTWRLLDLYTQATLTTSGLRRLRQRQSLAGADSWPLRARQNGAASGSWPTRQRQQGI